MKGESALALQILKQLLNKRDKGGIGEGERDEGDGDEEVHFEIQMGEFFIDNLKALQHDVFQSLESLVNEFESLVNKLESLINSLEALFEKFARDEFVPQFVFDFGFQELLVLEKFFFGSLLDVVNGRFQRPRQAFSALPIAQARLQKVESFARQTISFHF